MEELFPVPPSLPLRYRLPSFRPSSVSPTFVPPCHLLRPSISPSFLHLSFPPPSSPSSLPPSPHSPDTRSALASSASFSEDKGYLRVISSFPIPLWLQAVQTPKTTPHPTPTPEG